MSEQFLFRKTDEYCVFSFPEEVGKADLSSAKAITGDVITALSSIKNPDCLFDLTGLNSLDSPMVTSLVKIWKFIQSQNGRMVVVANNNQVVDILHTTGLYRVWRIVNKIETGIDLLGFSKEAKVAKREHRLIIFVGFAVICAFLALSFRLVPQLNQLAEQTKWSIYFAVALAIVASAIAVIREPGRRRATSAVVMLLSMVLLGACYYYIPFNSSGSTETTETTDQASPEGADRPSNPDGSVPKDTPTAGNNGEPYDSDESSSPTPVTSSVPAASSAPAVQPVAPVADQSVSGEGEP